MAAVLTYEKVKELCDQIRRGGKNPTARAIVTELGGSMGTANRFLNDWKQEQKNIEAAGLRQISDTLQDAILAEVGQCVNEQTKELAAQVSHLTETNTALSEDLARSEQDREDTEQKNAQLTQEKTQMQVDFDKEMAVLQQREKDLAEQNTALQAELETCRGEMVKLSRSEASLTATLEGLRQHIKELKVELANERDKNLQLVTDLARSEHRP